MTFWLKRCVRCLCSIQRVPGYMAGNRSWWVSGYQCYAILSSEDSSFPQSYNYCWWWGSGTQIRYTSNILSSWNFWFLNCLKLLSCLMLVHLQFQWCRRIWLRFISQRFPKSQRGNSVVPLSAWELFKLCESCFDLLVAWYTIDCRSGWARTTAPHVQLLKQQPL